MTGMPPPTDQLILALVRDATPVRRLRPPLWRALSWLAIVAVIATAATVAFINWQVFDARIRNPDLVMEMTGTLLTGCLAVIAAFHLSLPDRSQHWALLPIPSLILWLSGSSMGCYRHWLANPTGDWTLGDSPHCFMFIIAVGLPLSVGLLWALRRARPISPMPVALVGGLGAASLAAFLLQFFHPFDITFMDLSVHALAVLILIGVVATKPVRTGLLATSER
jgi:hypothetical protein